LFSSPNKTETDCAGSVGMKKSNHCSTESLHFTKLYFKDTPSAIWRQTGLSSSNSIGPQILSFDPFSFHAFRRVRKCGKGGY